MVKNLPGNAGDADSIPRLRSPEEGNGNPLQYFCLENPMDRRAQQATVDRVANSWMTKHSCMHQNVKRSQRKIHRKTGSVSEEMFFEC